MESGAERNHARDNADGALFQMQQWRISGSGEVLRRNEFVQINFGDQSERFDALERGYLRSMFVTERVIEQGGMGMAVTAG